MTPGFPYPPEVREELRNVFRMNPPPPEPAAKYELAEALRRIEVLEHQVHLLVELADETTVSFRRLLDHLGVRWK